MQRRQTKHTISFDERLAAEAMRMREKAHQMPFGRERDELLRNARQAETAAHIDQWLSSPGLQPPD
jgi:hypothetical protein